jgi:hypothetical protein
MKKTKMSGACSMYGESRGAYRVLVGKPEGRRLLLRARLNSEDNIKMDLRDLVCRALTVLIWLRIGTDSGFL